MKYICEQCTRDYKAPPSQKSRFCSRNCYDKSREGLFVCDNCFVSFTYYKSHKNGKRVYCSQQCQRQHMVGTNHAHWKGKGHRIIYEEFIGRKLKPEEIIHHINGIHTDNRIENMMIVTRAEHARIHKENGFQINHKPFPRPSYGGK